MPDFSQNSTNLSLPFIQPSQAQKHVTHNEALRLLDAVVQISVASQDVDMPPAAPDAGDRFILTASAAGGWSGQPAGTLAVFDETAWSYFAPQTGWLAWIEDTAQLCVFGASGWQQVSGAAETQNLPMVGIQTSADAVNRLSVASEATLLSHDGAGHQLKLNKAAEGDTASLLFQTGWAGRAEMGTAGSDDFTVKVSADGTDFHDAIVADAATGRVRFPQGADGLAPDSFGMGPLATSGYIAARGADLVTNGTGYLGNAYNYPESFSHDPQTAPNLPASFAFGGRFSKLEMMDEVLPVDPNVVYRLSAYLRQEGLPGDWSQWANGERHQQYMGLICFDLDGNQIEAMHHMRYDHGGVDSLTRLAAPLAPGDTSVQLEDASGWNETSTARWHRGMILFEYRNTAGYAYDRYSRLVEFDLFDLAGVDKGANIITLKAPFPSSLANPDDPSGAWPAGTKIANSSSGSANKYAFFSALVLPETDRWYRTQAYIGGLDRSGSNSLNNFPPGIASARLFWLPNYSNRDGGLNGFPDTGANHRVWFAGISVRPEPLAMMQTGAAGTSLIKVPAGDFAAGTLGLVTPSPTVVPV